VSPELVAGAPQTPPVPPRRVLYEDLVKRALQEDLGRAGDITTDAVVGIDECCLARVVARAPGRVAGLDVVATAFALLDPAVEVVARVRDGADVAPGDVLADVRGPARAVLTGERVALNFLGHLCGVATATNAIVALVEGTGARVVCTRKTTPLLRVLEKYAVRCGGGANHRYGLDDAVLIKDNHLALAGGVAQAVARARRVVGHMVRIEVEVTDLAQLREALALEVEAVLLDNMDLDTLAAAVRLTDRRAVTEASGGIGPHTARAVASTGVDLLSVGGITHSAAALDVALDVGA
jgi:nicotinate-nucleotide pyrophosphorylase (carboxylating)